MCRAPCTVKQSQRQQWMTGHPSTAQCNQGLLPANYRMLQSSIHMLFLLSACLQKALPSLACLIVDPSLKVREALASLLVAVSSSRSLHFYDVVPLPQLLDVMAHDAVPVARRIHQILLPSYFPNVQEGAVSPCSRGSALCMPTCKGCRKKYCLLVPYVCLHTSTSKLQLST